MKRELDAFHAAACGSVTSQQISAAAAAAAAATAAAPPPRREHLTRFSGGKLRLSWDWLNP